uniref:Uncharacterized protein n=1 Tax=Glossina pallidipes TaxID=7398 RepID=A0A1A9Z1M3_GLOPL
MNQVSRGDIGNVLWGFIERFKSFLEKTNHGGNDAFVNDLRLQAEKMREVLFFYLIRTIEMCSVCLDDYNPEHSINKKSCQGQTLVVNITNINTHENYSDCVCLSLLMPHLRTICGLINAQIQLGPLHVIYSGYSSGIGTRFPVLSTLLRKGISQNIRLLNPNKKWISYDVCRKEYPIHVFTLAKTDLELEIEGVLRNHVVT